MKPSPRPLRTPYKLSDSLHHRLNMYALAAGAAGVSAFALAQPVEAKIIYTPVHEKVIPRLPIDLNHDGIVDFYLNTSRDPDVGAHGLSACQYWMYVTGSTRCVHYRGTNAIRTINSNNFGWAAALRYGAKIQHEERFKKGGADLGGVVCSYCTNPIFFGPWLKGGRGVRNRYLGLKFKIEGRFHFGWARMTVTTTKNSFTAILTGYAYETIPGKAIIAGAIKGADDEPTTSFNTNAPQPATLGMLALGAPGLSIWKREESAGATTARN